MLNRSLIRATARDVSSKAIFGLSVVFCTVVMASSHLFSRIFISLSSSATLFPSAEVLTITPKFFGLMLCTSCFSLVRSSPFLIFDDTETFSWKGMSTIYLPAKLRSHVSRGPLVEIGSLTTCTNTSCPTFSTFCTLPSFLSSGSRVALVMGKSFFLSL